MYDSKKDYQRNCFTLATRQKVYRQNVQGIEVKQIVYTFVNR